MNTLESVTEEGDSPVIEILYVVLGWRMSRSGHEKPWLKMGGPPSKAKYYFQTDSEQVPWGKGEKNPGEGSEIEPETICLQSFRAVC